MFKEEFQPAPEIADELRRLAEKLDSLKNAVIESADIDQDANITIKLQDGRGIMFSLLAPEGPEAGLNPLEIKEV